MHSTPPVRKRKRVRAALAALAAAAPLPAFAADVGSAGWATYLFFALVATVVIVLLLHEALDEDGHERDDARTSDSLGIPRYVHAQQDPSSTDGGRRPLA